MSDHTTPRSSHAPRWAIRSLLAAVLLSLSAGAVAAGSGAMVVRGTQLAYGSCGNADGYQMTGDLVGCWWITEFNPQTSDDRHNLRATGTEHFEGWIGSRHGSFDTTFQYTAKMDGPWGSSAEIHGRCHHPVIAGSGTGDFAGITGELSFKDVVDVDPPYYPYWGSLRIAGEDLALNSSTALARTSGSATASTALSC